MGTLRSHGVAALVLLAAAGCGGAETGGDPSPGAAREAGEAPWLTEVTRDRGLEFVHDSGFDGSYYFPEHVGSGGALFDYDGDGDLDLYLVTSGPHGPEMGRSPVVNRLFRQEADGRFADRTAASGTGDAGYGMGAAVGDVDGDGDLDLAVTNLGRDTLYLNRGDGRFDRAPEAGLDAALWSTSACFLDLEPDGDLDLYVATYVEFDPERACTDRAGRPEYCGPGAFRGQPDLFYRNDGGGRFVEAAAELGVADVVSKGLGTVCADFDGDGRADVYVANDGEKNELWSLGADGRFADRALLMGAGLNLMGQAEASMGVVLGDLDGDGFEDLFIAHLDRETNTLYSGLDGGGFEDRTAAAGLGPPSLPFTGFGAVLVDLELDGDLDLAIANGRVRRGPEIAEPALAEPATASPIRPHWRPYAEPNLLFVNRGDGRFAPAPAAGGEFVARVEVGRSLLAGDLDLDGDDDLVLTNSNGPARLYRNDAPRAGDWLELGFAAPAGALGGRFALEAGGERRTATLASGESYLAAHGPWLRFGLGAAAAVDRLEAAWPSGARTRFLDLPAGRRLRLYPPPEAG